MIFVVFGTCPFQFERLIKIADEYAKVSGEDVLVQTGRTRLLPSVCSHKDFFSREEYLEKLEAAEIVIAHAGIGITLDCLTRNKKLILVPRLAKYDEHTDDHQSELADALEEQGRVSVIGDGMSSEEIGSLIEMTRGKENVENTSSRKKLITKMSEYINALEKS